MSQAYAAKGDAWTLLDEKGSRAVEFTSFISMNVQEDGSALSYPVEEGGFVNYNKTRSPRAISLTLAAQGDEADFGRILQRLAVYRKDAVMLTVVTPSTVYPNMTLKSFSNERGGESGAGMLVVNMSLVEVCELASQTGSGVISKPKNPTSASRIHTGLTVAVDVPETVMSAILRVKYF